MDYFGEKSHQISVTSINSFGINVSTRYGKAWQMAEMLMFTDALASYGLNKLVPVVFYDSKCDCCTFEFSQEISAQEKDGILECAKKHLSQFEWGDRVLHGNASDSF